MQLVSRFLALDSEFPYVLKRFTFFLDTYKVFLRRFCHGGLYALCFLFASVIRCRMRVGARPFGWLLHFVILQRRHEKRNSLNYFLNYVINFNCFGNGGELKGVEGLGAIGDGKNL